MLSDHNKSQLPRITETTESIRPKPVVVTNSIPSRPIEKNDTIISQRLQTASLFSSDVSFRGTTPIQYQDQLKNKETQSTGCFGISILSDQPKGVRVNNV